MIKKKLLSASKSISRNLPGKKNDLILLHAPSVYDFRKKSVLHGPVSDVIPSTQIFEMYPIGFMTILTYLEKHGHSVRIINIALQMLRNKRFDAEKLIRSLNPKAFGLDLHWMVHAHGSIEIAEIIKKYHPDIPIIFGGLSSSFYHQELIRYPQVDYVVRGDSAEEPMRQLIAAIKEGRTPEDVPNLTWKNGSGIRTNELSHVPSNLDNLCFDYRKVLKSCFKNLDLFGHIPFKAWIRYPIVIALSLRGCLNNCTICGGSAESYLNNCGRAKPAYRSPNLIASDMGLVAKYIKGPIMILGDIPQAGSKYATDLLKAIKKEKIKNHIALEFFIPPDKEFFKMAADTFPDYNIQISPESHDEAIRRASGRPYSNDTLERSISDALEFGSRRVDVFFLIGLHKQTPQSVMDTARYCEELIKRYGSKVYPFISPLAPFLDPGSRAFMNPEKHGYRLFHKTLKEHRKALLAPSWKYTLNYETDWMNRDELVDVTYEAALELNRIKLKYNLVSPEDAKIIAERIAWEKKLILEIDGIYLIDDEPQRDRRLKELMHQFETTTSSTICKKDEMNWPLTRISPLQVIEGFLFRNREK